MDEGGGSGVWGPHGPKEGSPRNVCVEDHSTRSSPRTIDLRLVSTSGMSPSCSLMGLTDASVAPSFGRKKPTCTPFSTSRSPWLIRCPPLRPYIYTHISTRLASHRFFPQNLPTRPAPPGTQSAKRISGHPPTFTTCPHRCACWRGV